MHHNPRVVAAALAAPRGCHHIVLRASWGPGWTLLDRALGLCPILCHNPRVMAFSAAPRDGLCVVLDSMLYHNPRVVAYWSAIPKDCHLFRLACCLRHNPRVMAYVWAIPRDCHLACLACLP